jgi:hypothetical protein
VHVQNTLRSGGQAFFREGIGCRSSLVCRLPLPFLTYAAMVCAMIGVFHELRAGLYVGVVVTASATISAVADTLRSTLRRR